MSHDDNGNGDVPEKDGISDEQSNNEQSGQAQPAAEPLSFRDLAFKKDENGEYYVNVIDIKDDDDYEPGQYQSFRDSYNSPLQGYEAEVFNPQTLTVHEPDLSVDPWERLNALIGLETVKKQLSMVEKRSRFDKARAQAGYVSDVPSNHFAFLGNPGTGKTEVARLLGAILHQAGVLSRGHVVEIDNSHLEAPYVGWSAIRTRETIKYARGGVLFIDEAHALFSNVSYDYGAEVISELTKSMEDNRDDLVIVMAGYKDHMKAMIASNPGLQSRIRHHVEFPDYSAEELYGIYKKYCADNQYNLDDDTDEALEKLINKAVRQLNNERAGNGRLVRNMFERTIDKLANRVMEQELDGDEHFSTIRFSDLPALDEFLGKQVKNSSGSDSNVRPLFPDDKDDE